MTSKNSWFSHQLLWDTFRKNLWLAALSFLTFFFSLPVATALILQQYQQDVANGYREETFARTVNEVMQPFSQSHPFVVFFIILGAVIAGTAVFYYLHNRQRTDFYHSLPLSRTKLFTINYTAGALLVLLPYVINILFTLIVVAANGYFGYLNGLEVLGNACHHILFFFAVYSLAVLAAMLTGNWVTNLLLTGVLSTIFPVFLGLYELGMQCFYATYYNASDLLLKLACWLSPVTRYITANGDVAPGVNIQNWEYGVWILVVLLLTAAALLLYRKRPSESAGHAIAFNWAKPIIKYPLILMFTLLVGFIFHSIGDDDSYQQWGWLIFGFVCGGLIISRIAEIVFAFDFKAIKSNWKGLIVFAVVFAVFISVPLFDLTGYDSYLPELKDVKAVNITTSGIDNLDQHDYYLYADFYGGSYDEAFYATTLLEEPENIQKALEIAALSLQDSQMEEDASLSDQASWFNDDLYTYTTVVYSSKRT